MRIFKVLPDSVFELVRETLGDHIYEKYVISKEKEWDSFRISVTDWELETYIDNY